MNMKDWQFISIVGLIIVAMLAMRPLVKPAQSHEVYENWLTSQGGSCCNDHDCAPVGSDQSIAKRWRLGKFAYEVLIGDMWVPLEPEVVRPYSHPDGNAHICIWNGKILCFVRGMEG
jgi:hypothetical protein